MTERPSNWQLWAMRLCLVAAFAGSCGVFALSQSHYARAAILPSSNACQYHMQTQLPAETRVIAIGSSRAREAIDPGDLANALDLERSQIANLAHSSVALGYDYGVIASLARKQDLDLVLFEVIARSSEMEKEERKIDPATEPPILGLSMGPARGSYALGTSFNDQAQRAFTDAPNTALAISDLMTLTANRISDTLALLRKKRIFPRLFQHDSSIDASRAQICALKTSRDDSGLTDKQRALRRQKIDQYRATFASWDDPAPLGYITDPVRAFDHATIEDMVALGDAHNFVPIFFFLPGIDVPVDSDLAPAFADRFDAPLLIPSPEVRKVLSRNGYYDNAHLNLQGGAVFANWLADELQSLGVDLDG
ncbi:hypothetical protein [Actibacterium sp. 188UL27-1]|uniref:hypothetical protein n=1 Tax=Actibacterium sp. 188UL27-1 TaxID=2786961 RepID=UPI00195CC69F|nr:hypothetical protein [Actibacterium sp. 188UL27-1]MBM7069032.1 hypothetical protein [Actibacterium sp. 188UL27-1]